MSFLKLWSQFFQEPVVILVISRLQLNSIYLLQSWRRIFVALSFFDLWIGCYSNLILKRITILLTVCVQTVRCIVWAFLECLSANKSLLTFLIYDCSALDFIDSSHSVTLSSSVLLQQICNSSSLSLCLADSCFNAISINFVLPALNTRLVSIVYFAIEERPFSSSFIHVSFLFILQLQCKVESSAYCMQLLFGVMLGMSATIRLNKIGPSIEPCSTP